MLTLLKASPENTFMESYYIRNGDIALEYGCGETDRLPSVQTRIIHAGTNDARCKLSSLQWQLRALVRIAFYPHPTLMKGLEGLVFVLWISGC